jgi:hypothetical protein
VPLGREVLPNARVVERAEKEDLNRPLGYQVRGAWAAGSLAVGCCALLRRAAREAWCPVAACA